MISRNLQGEEAARSDDMARSKRKEFRHQSPPMNGHMQIATIVDQTYRMRTPGKPDRDVKDPMLGFLLNIAQKAILWMENLRLLEDAATSPPVKVEVPPLTTAAPQDGKVSGSLSRDPLPHPGLPRALGQADQNLKLQP
jgi:hypothetical protein